MAVVVIGKIASDPFIEAQPARQADRNMPKIAEEMNLSLPRTVGILCIERVEYSERVLHFYGMVVDGQESTAPAKTAAQDQLKNIYCPGKTFSAAKASVEYTNTQVAMRSINDRLRSETWSTTVRPEH